MADVPADAPRLRDRVLRPALRRDVDRAITMGTGGAVAFAAVEYVLALSAYPAHTAVITKLRLAALTLSLSLVLWLGLVLALAGTLAVARLARAQLDPDRAGAAGWFVPSPLVARIRRGVPVLWAALVAAGLLALFVQRVGALAITSFKEPQLTAGVIAFATLLGAVLVLLVHRLALVAITAGARALAPILGFANPLGRWRAAGLALVGVLGGLLVVAWYALPQSRSVLPVRLLVSGVAIAFGAGVAAQQHARPFDPRDHSPLLPTLILLFLGAVWIFLPGRTLLVPVRVVVGITCAIVALRLGECSAPPRERTPRRAGLVAGLGLALVTMTFGYWGGDPETKIVAVAASPALEKLVGVVRFANDLDRDGDGTLLGEADCAPFDPSINRGAIDIPDDGIDQNCDGHDFSLSELTASSGPTASVPASFQQPWNVLLITIDTVRYDRTTFGGYAHQEKKRDTTPRLAELVKRSTSFTFANAPSAGTMASIPAILTSKFFHSGIALGDAKPGVPPKILPENTTLPEIMKRGGYTTGVIGSHEWWNDWGLEQGVDEYDNSIGKKPDPFIVAADKVTDHALSFMSRHQGQKWFLWAHYIDPHGRYVGHPDVVDWGSAEPDLYDSELRWTDQELGRLLDELRRLPTSDRTIVIITSDHGDSMGEHGIPLGTHGMALYREMLHVPLIFYIPNNPPHLVGGAVTPLDILPTIAALCGIDVSDLSFEGRSLVGPIFTGTPEKERIVFAETNAPNKQRAAISQDWKLIHRFVANVDELYDLTKDPWEKDNVAPKRPPALATMKQALSGWLDRVMYTRDPLFNQAFRQMRDVLATQPAPVPTVARVTIGDAIEVSGIGAPAGAAYAPGAKIQVNVYLHATRAVPASYRFQMVVWPRGGELTDAIPAGAVRSALRATADGAYATDRWKVGEAIRETFEVTLPSTWAARELVVGLISADSLTGQRAGVVGPTPTQDPAVAILGTLPVTGGSPAPAPP